MRRFGVVGCGSNVVDKFLSVRAIPRPGEKGYFSTDKVVDGEVVGGVTLNHLAWAGAFGTKTALLARQGEDESGRLVRKVMGQLGVSTEFVDVSPNHVTSESYVIKQDDGERSILMAPGGTTSITDSAVSSLWTGDNTPFTQTTLFSTEISQVPLSGVMRLLQEAVKGGVVATALDVDVSPSVAVKEARLGSVEELVQCVNMADVLKPARHAAEELLAVLSSSSVEEVQGMSGQQIATALLSSTNAKMVALTEGSSGCSIASHNHPPLSIPPPLLAKVTDTTGAGDAFFGGLLAAIAHLGTPWTTNDTEVITRMGKTANMAGAMNCQTLGGLPQPGTKLDIA